jgi:phosphoribosylformylglycinamidine (FGAM) synthase-like amidotransferase family enzyme
MKTMIRVLALAFLFLCGGFASGDENGMQIIIEPLHE